MLVATREIFIPPDRQRVKIDEGKVNDLAVSINARGLLHPIVIAPLDRVRFPDAATHLKYQLVAGYRRLLATVFLKKPDIDATFREDLTDELEQKEIELEENLLRENLDWRDEIKAKADLLALRKQKYGDSVRDVAEKVGASVGSFWEDARLAEAIKVMPSLGESKNKSQAQSKLRHALRTADLTLKARELEKQAKDVVEEGPGQFNWQHKIFLGDCVEVVKEWADGCLHCVVTDPPYGMDLDKGETKRGSNYVEIYADDHYDIMDVYALIAKEAFRLLRDNTHAYFFFDIKSYGKILRILTDVGFKVDPVPLAWVKTGSGQVNHPDSRWASCYETAFFCRKGNRALLKQGQSNCLVYDPVPPAKKIHPVEKPVALIRQLIESSTVPGETVGDFFGGSGSTGEAALQTGRNYLLCEKNPAYHAGIVERLSKFAKGGLDKPTTTSGSSGGTSEKYDPNAGEDDDWEAEQERMTKGF